MLSESMSARANESMVIMGLMKDVDLKFDILISGIFGCKINLRGVLSPWKTFDVDLLLYIFSKTLLACFPLLGFIMKVISYGLF